MSERLIAVFRTTTETLKAEKSYKEAGLAIRTTIKPRKISSDCQLALTFPEERLPDIVRIATREKMDLVGLYRPISEEQWERIG